MRKKGNVTILARREFGECFFYLLNKQCRVKLILLCLDESLTILKPDKIKSLQNFLVFVSLIFLARRGGVRGYQLSIHAVQFNDEYSIKTGRDPQ